ncbi:MAG: 2-C-methyl-D-erythritol 4-phosphate cytidylyltransferase [Deltaproteobacteria bacterium]|nr:2-C-methyl-D-erythritol 4-phosphate cytidylyltransferase [Deltaproteobacteria bacterium]
MRTVAIIVAGGSGKRMNTPVPKQFINLGGMPVLSRTISRFEQASSVTRIVLVVPKGDMEHVRHSIVGVQPRTKVIDVVAGGAARQDSVRNGLGAVGDEADIVVIHDGVRPFVDVALIEQVIAEAVRFGAAALAVPVRDTVKAVGTGGVVLDTPDRETLRFIQTPQAFQREILAEAYRKAYQDGFYGTDDAGLVERMGHPVRVMEGSYRNIKITTEDDLLLAGLLAEAEDGEPGEGDAVGRYSGVWSMKTGFGYDSHRFVEGRPLYLGGVEIPHDKGLLGHSDADVLLHAIGDAILGALGAGDLGRHFPDSDPRYRNIRSRNLLSEICDMVHAGKFRVSNVDATIILEHPKLATYRDAITRSTASILGIPEKAVNVKAKTNEGMGFIGRGEGIAAMAVVTLEKTWGLRDYGLTDYGLRD